MKLWPTREAHKTSDIVMDLDDLIASPVAFVFKGKTHYIKPLTTKEFFSATNELSKMLELGKKKTVSADELVTVYANLFASVCSTIGRREVEQMQQSQVSALFQLILDRVQGKKPKDSDEKKKLIH